MWSISFKVLVAFRCWPSLAKTCKGLILSLKTLLHLMELNPDFNYILYNQRLNCKLIDNIIDYCVGVKVLTAGVLNSPVFWVITPCSPLKVNRHFEGTCGLHLHGWRVSQTRKQHEVGSRLADGRDMFLRNIGGLPTDYTALYPRI
jgi:hypothetical protein